MFVWYKLVREGEGNKEERRDSAKGAKTRPGGKKKKCLHAGLNHGPLDNRKGYKSSALPLSYKGDSYQFGVE